MKNYVMWMLSYSWLEFFSSKVGMAVAGVMVLAFIADLFLPLWGIAIFSGVWALLVVCMVWLQRRKDEEGALACMFTSYLFLVEALAAAVVLAAVLFGSRPAHAETMPPREPPATLRLFAITAEQLDELGRRVALAEFRAKSAESRAAELQVKLQNIEAAAEAAKRSAGKQAETSKAVPAPTWRCT